MGSDLCRWMWELAGVGGNRWCADCERPDPQYIVPSLGSFVCKVCSDAHRGQKRATKNFEEDVVTEDDLRRMENVGNDRCNRKYMAKYDSRDKDTIPLPTIGDLDSCKNFIWLKYSGAWELTKEEKEDLRTFRGPPPPTVSSIDAPFPERRPSYGGPRGDVYHPSGYDRGPPPPTSQRPHPRDDPWRFDAANYSGRSAYDAPPRDQSEDWHRDGRGHQGPRHPPATNAHRQPLPYREEGYNRYQAQPPSDNLRSYPSRGPTRAEDPYADNPHRARSQLREDDYRMGPPAHADFKDGYDRRGHREHDERDEVARSGSRRRAEIPSKKPSSRHADLSDEEDDEGSVELAQVKAKSKSKKSSTKIKSARSSRRPTTRDSEEEEEDDDEGDTEEEASSDHRKKKSESSSKKKQTTKAQGSSGKSTKVAPQQAAERDQLIDMPAAAMAPVGAIPYQPIAPVTFSGGLPPFAGGLQQPMPPQRFGPQVPAGMNMQQPVNMGVPGFGMQQPMPSVPMNQMHAMQGVPLMQAQPMGQMGMQPMGQMGMPYGQQPQQYPGGANMGNLNANFRNMGL